MQTKLNLLKENFLDNWYNGNIKSALSYLLLAGFIYALSLTLVFGQGWGIRNVGAILPSMLIIATLTAVLMEIKRIDYKLNNLMRKK